MPDPLGELQLRDPWFPTPPVHRRTHGHAPPTAPPRSGLPMGARSAPLLAPRDPFDPALSFGIEEDDRPLGLTLEAVIAGLQGAARTMQRTD
eukprot:7387870-Heterocapsa_arctica.AAC.1